MKKIIVLALAAALMLPACVKVDQSLGKGLVDKSLLYDTYTETFYLEETQMRLATDLSGFSDAHLTIGAIRDEDFGLTTREAAFPLIPALDTIDLGRNPKAVGITVYFAGDTVSCASDNQARILQNIRVTELLEPLDINKRSAMGELAHGTELLTEGLPVYNGSGALSFTLRKEYAQRYVDVISSYKDGVLKDRSSEDGTDHYEDFVKALPGIYLEVEAPEGIGGRINLFEFSCMEVSSGKYYRNSNVAMLTVNSTWGNETVPHDSSFVLVPGEIEFVDEQSYTGTAEKFSQYTFNRTTHTTRDCAPTDKILVEGGCGLKPVIRAEELRRKTAAAITAHGGDPLKAIIVKATIILPYDMPEDFRDMKYYPSVLSPTIRTEREDENGNPYIAFAGLTDASVSAENQGDIDRSNLVYSPDISYHLQELMPRTDLETATNGDIWLLTIHTEKVANANSSSYDDEYYQQLLYANYYNSLYGGYGGYGYGYGGYGYGGYGYNSYSNYYSYMMLAQMYASANQQTYSYTTELDKDRYYHAVLCGPASQDRRPSFRVTFDIPKE